MGYTGYMSTSQQTLVQIKRTELPEYQAYVQMLMIYKQKKSDYALFLKNCRHLQDSGNPLERLRFFEEQKAHSEVCKKYYAAKRIYEEAAARLECTNKGIDLSPLGMAKLASISIPVSMSEIVADERKQRIIENTPSEEMAELMRINLEIMNQKGSGSSSNMENLRDSILSERAFDPTDGDFEPLP